MTALMLLSNAGTDDSKRVSILAAASASMEEIGNDPSNDQFLPAVTYESVSIVPHIGTCRIELLTRIQMSEKLILLINHHAGYVENMDTKKMNIYPMAHCHSG